MATGIVLLFVMGALSMVTTTAEQRAESRERFARRWNRPLQVAIVLMLAFILYPWTPQ